jgi:hypothetical protein
MTLSRAWLAALIIVLAGVLPAHAQSQNSQVVANCGTPNSTYTAGQNAPTTQDTNGKGCINGTFTGTIVTAPGSRTIVALDISSVTTGGTAVNALSAGHATAGMSCLPQEPCRSTRPRRPWHLEGSA